MDRIRIPDLASFAYVPLFSRDAEPKPVSGAEAFFGPGWRRSWLLSFASEPAPA